MKHKKLFLFALILVIFTFSSNLVLAKTSKVTSRIPTAPTGLTSTVISSSEIDLSWTAVSGASGYKVFRASPNDSSYTQIATVTSNTYKNIGLTAATKYWYFVRAYNSYGTSGDSTHISTTTNQVASTTTTTTTTTTITPGKVVLGFATYYYSGDSSSYNSMSAHYTTIDEIATDTYTTDGLGNISGMVPTSQITFANSKGIKAYVMITNNFDGNIAKTLLESSINRQNLINNTLNAIKANSYKGVNVDLEGIYYYDRSYFTTFMSELYSTLHAAGYTVTASVPAKTYDSTTDGWNGAFDYANIAKYSDQVLIMAYDEHYQGGSAGPIASIGWVKNVVNYAVTVIPTNKILLGVAAYGYDWSSNGTKAYSINQINNLATTYGAQIQWDSVSQSPYFYYTDGSGVKHTVWFENAASVGYKLDLVNSSNLAGIGIWRLGLENEDYWTTIKTKFNRQ